MIYKLSPDDLFVTVIVPSLSDVDVLALQVMVIHLSEEPLADDNVIHARDSDKVYDEEAYTHTFSEPPAELNSK